MIGTDCAGKSKRRDSYLKYHFRQLNVTRRSTFPPLKMWRIGRNPWLVKMRCCGIQRHFQQYFRNISWGSVYLVEETGGPGENHRPAARKSLTNVGAIAFSFHPRFTPSVI